MKRALRYLKFISLGLIGTLVIILLVNQIPTEHDAAVDETIASYQPDLEKNELAENPLYLFLQQNKPTPELMAVYAHLLSTTELPKIPPRLDVHKPILKMYRWNKELLKHAETHSEKEKLKIFAALVDSCSKILENRITMIEFKMATATVRQTLDWASAEKWTPKAIDKLKELSQKISALIEKREALVRNALNGEKELSFEITLNMDFTNLELNQLDSEPHQPVPETALQAKILAQVGPWFYDRNQTLNLLNARFEKLIAAVTCLQDYSCDKQQPITSEISLISMLRNPVGKGILKVLALRDNDVIRNQEVFQKLEQSNKNFSSLF